MARLGFLKPDMENRGYTFIDSRPRLKRGCHYCNATIRVANADETK